MVCPLTPVQIVPPRKNVEGTRGTYRTHPCAARFRIPVVETMSTPALYRTRITHLRRAPVHHYFEHHGYSWYVDVDRLPELPRWLRPFARFEACDHFWAPEAGEPNNSLRHRIDSFFAQRGVDLNGGKITALMQARVLGYVFNPVSLYWCHDADGVLRHVIAEMHNTSGERHAYLLPPHADRPAVARKSSTSPVQRGRRLLPRARAAPGRRTRCANFAASREPARAHRDATRRQASRRHRSAVAAAVDGAARSVDGRHRISRPDHHTPATTSSAHDTRRRCS